MIVVLGRIFPAPFYLLPGTANLYVGRRKAHIPDGCDRSRMFYEHDQFVRPHTPSVSQRPIGRFPLALRLAPSIRHGLFSGDSPQKSRTRSAARPHVFDSTADTHNVRQFVTGHCPDEMTPDRIGQGSFLFLGFNHWVTSLSAGSTGLFCLVGIPSAAFMFFSVRCDWHLCKTEDVESPAGRCTYHIWYHLFSYHQSTTPQGFLQDGKQHK